MGLYIVSLPDQHWPEIRATLLTARKGVWTDLMKPVVAKLTDEDFVSIAAYLSSRVP